MTTTLTNGADTYIGTSGVDAIYGLDENDTISGLAGDDALYGEDGQDQLDGGAGNDLLNGGLGDDIILNVEFGDTVDGGAGFDVVTTNQTVFSLMDSNKVTSLDAVVSTSTSAGVTLTGNAGNNLLVGGYGTDTINAGLGDDIIYGGSGVDIVNIGAGSAILTTSIMNMSLPAAQSNLYGVVYFGLNQLIGPPLVSVSQPGIRLTTTDGNDWIASDVEYVKFSDGKTLSVGASINAGQAVFVTSGTANADTLTGTEAIDMLDGGSGNDTLYGLGGQDIISGGDGNDVIDGGIGMDTMSGGAGDDVFVLQGNDADSIDGGGGNDTIKLASNYSSANLTVDLNMSTSWVNVENITVDSGLLQGYTLVGNAGANTLTGGSGADALRGGAGNDTLDGGAGSDTVYFSGLRSDYSVSVAPTGVITVIDNRTTLSGNDGTDTIKVGVETIRFDGSPNSFIDGALTAS
jgi:Ca2+-binding RTX toxin-like protein